MRQRPRTGWVRKIASRSRARADALEKQLSRLTLTEKTPHPEQRIARDGTAVDRAVLGTAVPLDPGPGDIELDSFRNGVLWGAVRGDGSYTSSEENAFTSAP
jgi:hypothetical protein